MTATRTITQNGQRRTAAAGLIPLVVDVVIPTAAYYGARDIFSVSLVHALIVSAILPVARTCWSWARDRALNGLAALMMAVDAAGIGLSFASGDARLLFAKNSITSSVIAIGIIVSVGRGRPLMSAGLRPFVTRGEASRESTWDRLAGRGDRFARYERRYSLIWGVALLADCMARLVCAFTVPIATLSWLSTVVLVGAIVVAVIVSGATAAGPMTKLVDTEA